MNIGFDASRAFIGNRTGTENYSYQLLKHISLIDHTNNYYIYLRPEQQNTVGVLRAKPLRNFKFITIPVPRLWTQVGLALETFKTPLDVLFIPSHTLPLIHKPGLKTVLTVHDLGAEFLPQTHQLKQRLYLNLMTHHQLKTATHLIAVSNSTKQDIIKKVGVSAEKISVVYEGFDNKIFKPISQKNYIPILAKYNLVDHSYFLFVGTIQPRKNLERLIKAYKIFLDNEAKSEPITLARGDTEEGSRRPARNDSEDGRRDTEVAGPRARTSSGGKVRQNPLKEEQRPALVLAGGKGWLSKEIYSLPKKLGIDNQVKFLGYVPDEELPSLYNGAKAFLFPSLFEGFGLPILEAMACSCPVLTSNISSMPEVAGDAALLVDPYSVESIAQGIIKINNNGAKNKLIKTGLEQSERFSWERAAKQTIKVFESLKSS